MSRDVEFWQPELRFIGETVFVLASGPSLTGEVLEKVQGRRCIVVNSSVLSAPWADVWFFTDTGVFERHRTIVEGFRGLVVTMSRKAKRAAPERVHRVAALWSPDFPRPGTAPIRQGRSSGHTAISLAIAMGARRVVMLGYDMRLVDGREHEHSEYRDKQRDLNLYEREFVPAFAGWSVAAAAAGVEILNATPGSAVTEFPMIDLERALSC